MALNPFKQPQQLEGRENACSVQIQSLDAAMPCHQDQGVSTLPSVDRVSCVISLEAASALSSYIPHVSLSTLQTPCHFFFLFSVLPSVISITASRAAHRYSIIILFSYFLYCFVPLLIYKCIYSTDIKSMLASFQIIFKQLQVNHIQDKFMDFMFICCVCVCVYIYMYIYYIYIYIYILYIYIIYIYIYIYIYIIHLIYLYR